MTDRGSDIEYFASCLTGLEQLLAEELNRLHIHRVRPLGGGVAFFGSVIDGERVCLWSRLASRVTAVLGRVDASTADTLYQGIHALAWEDEILPEARLAVKVHGTNRELRNTHFTALKAKDAICDRLRERTGKRPEVDRQHPDIVIEVRLRENKASISLDLPGSSLYQRTYFDAFDGEDAPLEVAQAAGLLAALGAPRKLMDGWGLIDPACNDGFAVCEAASMAADQAPGLLRVQWGFYKWARHNDDQWSDELALADERYEAGLVRLMEAQGKTQASLRDIPDAETVLFVGRSSSSPSVARGRRHLKNAGLRSVASIEAEQDGESGAVARVSAAIQKANPEASLLVVHADPPSHAADDARAVAEASACVAAARLAPEGALFGFVGTGDMAVRFRMQVAERKVIGRGRAEAVLEIFDKPPQEPAVIQLPNPQGGTEISLEVNDARAAQFAARLRKVAKERRKWAAREHIHAYRIYDADLPEYAASIDIYESTGDSRVSTYARVAEYQAPRSIDPALARARFEDILAITPVVLGMRPDQVFSKTRQRAKGGSQYTEAKGRHYVIETTESGLKFEIDLSGYLDTGLFLDHRVTREMVGNMAQGKRFLNLFAYTGTATVHAAAGGATATTTVDLSSTYLEWAQRNMVANGFDAKIVEAQESLSAHSSAHELVRTDVMRWISEARKAKARYDLIFVDPPTFSNSKAMGKRTWDVQRDHVELLIGVSRLLARNGVVIFSCNLRGFKPDYETLEKYGVILDDITAQTIPHDFERNPKIHHCYLVRRVMAKS